MRDLLLSVSVAALVLGGAELLCRRVETPPRPLEESDRVTDWQQDWGTDFYVMQPDSAGWPPTGEFNRDGVRDRGRTEAKPAGTRRVVCLGDSVTLGYGLRPWESYPSRLQALLDDRGPGVEVMTVALMGWAARQERIAYERIARRYAPDLVLLGLCLNDLQDLQNNLARPPGWLSWLHRRSALVRRAVDAEGRQIRSVRDLVVNPEATRVRQGYDRLFEEVRQLRKEVEQDGATLAVVVFPFADQVRGQPMAATPQRTIEAFCSRENIRCLDPLPELSSLGEAAFRPGDHLHQSAEGCARTASVIAGSGLIPEEWASSSALTQAGSTSPLGLGPTDVPALINVLDVKDGRVRREAAWALGRIGPDARASWAPLAARLDDPDEAVRLEAARALGRLRAARARAALFRAIGDRWQAVRWGAAEALAAIGLEHTDTTHLVDALASNDPYIRAFGAWALGEMGSVAAWTGPSLARRLEDVDPGVRSNAATALGRIGDGEPAVVSALGQALQDRSWPGRWRAARALGLLGSSSGAAVPRLAAALDDDDERVRREAARALGRVGSAAETALPALVAARRDASQSVREAAAAAVAQLTTSVH